MLTSFYKIAFLTGLTLISEYDFFFAKVPARALLFAFLCALPLILSSFGPVSLLLSLLTVLILQKHYGPADCAAFIIESLAIGFIPVGVIFALSTVMAGIIGSLILLSRKFLKIRIFQSSNLKIRFLPIVFFFTLMYMRFL